MRVSILILLLSLITFSLETNLRKKEDKSNLPSILDYITPIYESLFQQMLKEKVNMKKK